MTPFRLPTLAALVACAIGCGATPTTSDAAMADGGVRPLDARAIPQFVEPLVIPSAMPPSSTASDHDEYRIAVAAITQQVLPSSMPPTTVWAYGSEGAPDTFHWPGLTVEGRSNRVARVTWINALVDDTRHYLRHPLAIDATLHWAMTGDGAGPVPLVAHVHGAHVGDASDGNPDAWFLPDAIDLPAGITTRGSFFHSLEDVGAAAAVFEYPNDQPAAALWYHDHALGITRLNVYQGLAGFWILRDAIEDGLDLPGPAPQVGDAPGARHYEIPLAIQDRSFFEDGSLRYPRSRAEFDGYEGPYAPETPIAPRWNPEFFGDTMTVNGRTWPFVEVEPRLYRFRVLNGSNARVLVLRFDRPELVFHVIGGDGGWLSGAPVERTEIRLAPGERSDVLVDFSSLASGDRAQLLNVGPDGPLRALGASFAPADPETTGRVLEVRAVPLTTDGVRGSIPTTLPTITPLATTISARDLTLSEITYDGTSGEIVAEGQLGTAYDGPRAWDDEVTETPHLGDTEIWRFANLTEDAHPVHLHLVSFQVLDRTPLDAATYGSMQRAWIARGRSGAEPRFDDFFTAAPIAPSAEEAGAKDTVIAPPGMVTRVIARFDRAGSYVWHCHILEHEDHEMMRMFRVVP